MKKPTINTPPPNTCPVCGLQLAPHELEPHFHTELERLYKLSMGSDRHRMRNGPNSNSFNINALMHPHGHPGAPGPGNGTSGGGGGILNSQPGPDSRWETFQRIRNNRQSRLRAKARKRKCDSESEFGDQQQQMLRTAAQCQSCPVCHGRLQRTAEEIAQHVDECMRKQSSNVARLQQQHAQAQNVPAEGALTTATGAGAGAGAAGNGGGNSESNGVAEEEEDETVDVESYGDETSVTSGVHTAAVNLAPGLNQSPLPSHIIPTHPQQQPPLPPHHHHHHHHSHNHHHQHHPNLNAPATTPLPLQPSLPAPSMPNHNNNHIVKIDSNQSPPLPPSAERPNNEEHHITSMTNPWDRKHRLTIGGGGPTPMTTTLLPTTPGAAVQSHHQTAITSAPPPPTVTPPVTLAMISTSPPTQTLANVSRATPTSSDQVSEYEPEHRVGQGARERSDSRHSSGCEPDEEHVIIDQHHDQHHHQHHQHHNSHHTHQQEEAQPSAAKKARICDKSSTGESNW